MSNSLYPVNPIDEPWALPEPREPRAYAFASQPPEVFDPHMGSGGSQKQWEVPLWRKIVRGVGYVILALLVFGGARAVYTFLTDEKVSMTCAAAKTASIKMSQESSNAGPEILDIYKIRKVESSGNPKVILKCTGKAVVSNGQNVPVVFGVEIVGGEYYNFTRAM